MASKIATESALDEKQLIAALVHALELARPYVAKAGEDRFARVELVVIDNTLEKARGASGDAARRPRAP